MIAAIERGSRFVGHVYDAKFFDWVNLTALRSARHVLPLVQAAVRPHSVVDVGCGQGAWLKAWSELGLTDVLGLDGDYVDQTRLLFPADRFVPADLTRSFGCDRRFDLVQSLEVGEHLNREVAPGFVRHLCSLGDVVLFSAAQPGQGGERHVNERHPSYWAGLFREQGYAAFDYIRPRLARNRELAPWYQFNTVLYANAAGQARLGPAVLASRSEDLEALDGAGDLAWALRRAVLRPLPTAVVSWLSRVHYRISCSLQRAMPSA